MKLKEISILLIYFSLIILKFPFHLSQISTTFQAVGLPVWASQRRKRHEYHLGG